VISEPDIVRSEVQSFLGKVAVQRHIEVVLFVDDFIDPVGEIIEDDEDVIEAQILDYIVEA
jgi:hypothetical protein